MVLPRPFLLHSTEAGEKTVGNGKNVEHLLCGKGAAGCPLRYRSREAVLGPPLGETPPVFPRRPLQ